jgi:osmotically-inducible protein OsmY
MKTAALAILCLIGLSGCDRATKPTVTAGPSTDPRSASTKGAGENVEPDNTAVNERDRNAKTPINQNENKADVTTTAEIRKKVVATKMSTDAQNVKIITQDGKVTLRGPVETEDEKTRIEQMAEEVAGAANVDSQLEVKGDR